MSFLHHKKLYYTGLEAEISETRKRQLPMDSIDLEDYTETLTAYNRKCIDDVAVIKTITSRPNQRPWLTAEVWMLMRTQDAAFRSREKATLKAARTDLS